MAASNEILFLMFSVVLLTFSAFIVIIFNHVFARLPRFLIMLYSLILTSFIYFWLLNYWGRLEMNSASVHFSSNPTILSFTPKKDGEYDISLRSENDSTNDFFKKCEFYWLADAKSETECKNALIYKKISVNINDTIIVGQYHYRDFPNPFDYGYSIIDKRIPSLNLTKIFLKKNQVINLKVSIDTSKADILKDNLILLIGPNQLFYYEGIGNGIFLLIISIPIVISIISIGLKLRRKIKHL